MTRRSLTVAAVALILVVSGCQQPQETAEGPETATPRDTTASDAPNEPNPTDTHDNQPPTPRVGQHLEQVA